MLINNIVLAVLCAFAVVQDLLTRKVKNSFNVASAFVAFACVLITKDISIKSSLLGLVSAFVLGILLWKLGAFKAGDAKFMWTIGILKGFESFWVTMVIAIFAGALMGIVIIIINRDFKARMKRLWNYFAVIFMTRKYTTYEAENPKEMPFTIPLMIGCIFEYFMLRFL